MLERLDLGGVSEALGLASTRVEEGRPDAMNARAAARWRSDQPAGESPRPWRNTIPAFFVAHWLDIAFAPVVASNAMRFQRMQRQRLRSFCSLKCWSFAASAAN